MIWVVGSKGMLGSRLCQELSRRSVQFVGTDMEVDIRDGKVILDHAKSLRPSWILNCSAYTAVDKAETELELARSLNVDGPSNLAAAATDVGASIVHISTDYVFDGESPVPYTEDMATNPLSVYGQTKLDGEKAVLSRCEKAYIIRVSWLYGPGRDNFPTKIIKILSERNVAKVVSDQFGSPTYTGVFASNLAALASRSNAKPFGTYHYSDEGDISWFDFASAVREEALARGFPLKPDCVVEPVGSDAFPVPARRPRNSRFDKSKVRRVLGFDVRPWRENLKSFLDETRSK